MSPSSPEAPGHSNEPVIMRRILTMIAAAVCSASLAAAPAVWGQDWDDDEPAQPVQNVPSFVLNEATFGQWAFGVQDLATVRTRLDAYLTVKIHDVDRACALSTSQQEKLKLAGRGDLKRIWERVEEKRRKYVDRPHEQTKVNGIIQDVQSLRAIFTGDSFGEGTLFAKALHTMLSDEQAARYETAQQDRREYRRRAFANVVVATLDPTVGFSDEQRRRFLEVILPEIQLPPRPGPLDHRIAMSQVARIPEERLRGLFDDAQWGVVQRRLDQARKTEAALIRQGALPPIGDSQVIVAPVPKAVRAR